MVVWTSVWSVGGVGRPLCFFILSASPLSCALMSFCLRRRHAAQQQILTHTKQSTLPAQIRRTVSAQEATTGARRSACLNLGCVCCRSLTSDMTDSSDEQRQTCQLREWQVRCAAARVR